MSPLKRRISSQNFYTSVSVDHNELLGLDVLVVHYIDHFVAHYKFFLELEAVGGIVSLEEQDDSLVGPQCQIISAGPEALCSGFFLKAQNVLLRVIFQLVFFGRNYLKSSYVVAL